MQDACVAWLMNPATHGGAAVERIDTHSAIVFLAGERALKMKRDVRYDYLDFSTLERRRRACEAEVRINHPAAPSIYRGVVAITRQPDGSLALDGPGEAVEWLVDMRRFDQNGLLDRLAAREALDLGLMRPLARAIAAFHAQAARRPDHGGSAGMRWVIDGNARAFADQGRGILDQHSCARLVDQSRAMLERHRALLDARQQAGFVRQCHGDLHLRNLVLLEGEPTLFDAIEFDDRIACVDVTYDLAFLLMDLWHRRLRRHANMVFNAWTFDTGDLGGLALLPLFLSCRAAVRAKTSATAARMQADPSKQHDLESLAAQYLKMAGHLLEVPAPRLLAVGGLSGSGKSTLAQALAPDLGGAPGALLVRSDEIRKRLLGVDSTTRLGPEGYRDEVTVEVYEAMAKTTETALAAGRTVIADAMHRTPATRQAIEAVARRAGVPFTGLWLDAPASVLLTRVATRPAGVSDADVGVLERQLTGSVGSMDWIQLNASEPEADVARAARTHCGLAGRDGP
jgi:hypothetical protein